MIKRIAFALLLFGALVLTGCNSIVDKDRQHDDGGENIPWNTRAGWEDESIMGF
jgi:hypothetical protein